MYPKIIYDDSILMVIDKPSGWIVNRAETTRGQLVVQDWLESKFDYQIAKDNTKRSGVVHRIDKETSGILLIAKTSETFYELQDQFKKRMIRKKYTALAHGIIEGEGDIVVPVGRLPWSRKKFGILPGGRDSATHYNSVSYYQLAHRNNNSGWKGNANEKYTLLELFPKTGRTHQIRIHLKYLGHPVVSDELYAGRKTARKDRTWCPRLFLHASEISFKHPESGEMISFKNKLPEELKSVLASLEKFTNTN